MATGICVRLYPKEILNEMEKTQKPSILSSEVAKTVLRLKLVKEPIKLVDDITPEARQAAEELLKAMNAIDGTYVYRSVVHKCNYYYYYYLRVTN